MNNKKHSWKAKKTLKITFKNLRNKLKNRREEKLLYWAKRLTLDSFYKCIKVIIKPEKTLKVA